MGTQIGIKDLFDFTHLKNIKQIDHWKKKLANSDQTIKDFL